MTTYFKTMGNYLKTKREATGLSQMKAAKVLGYTSPQFVSNVERGLCMFPLKKMPKLAKLYNFDLQEVRGIVLTEWTKEVDKVMGTKAQ